MACKAHEAVRQHLIALGQRMGASGLPVQAAARAAMDEYFTATPLPQIRCLPAAVPQLRAAWLVDENLSSERRMLFLHGGGYVAGGIRAYRNFAMWIARAMHCAVLLIDYRLAPEHPFPAALEDAVMAFQWMREHGPLGRAPAQRTFLLGDSAGGGLALAALLALRERHEDLGDATVTFSAWTDLTNSGASMMANEDLSLGAVKAVPDLFAGLYLQQIDPRNPLASPLFGALDGLPPLLMQASTTELFLDDTVRLAEKAQNAAVEVHLDLWSDLVHVWQGYAPLLPEAIEALRRAGEFIQAI